MENKNNKGLIVLIVILIIMILGLGSYIVYDKVIANDKTINDSTNNSDNVSKDEASYKSYNIGDKVTVKLNDSTEATFYVLKQSSETEQDVTLFAEKNIGTGAFNNDYSEGNEYKGSLIESKLNELTSSWTNVKEKRLITVDEIKSTGLTETKNEDRCIDGGCPADYTYVKENSFLLYPGKDFEKNHLYEFYWTMTKVNNSEITGNTNRYVYYVHMSGSIDSHIVGYKPGGEWNPDGNFFTNFGIRPVIVISKEYVKN